MRTYPNRRTVDLAGVWDFAFLGDVADHPSPETAVFADVMAVPGCFDATVKYAGKRGVAAYRKSVDLLADKTYRLWIDGGHHVVTLFAGGEEIGTHVGGFTQFAFDFTPTESGPTDLILFVDNRIDYDRCPTHLDYFDWHHFGGISRGCVLQELPEVRIEAVRFVTTDSEKRRATVSVEAVCPVGSTTFAVTLDGTKLYNGTADEAVASKGAAPDSGSRSAGSGATIELTAELECPDLELWSPENPVLYKLEVTVGEDKVVEQVGLRTVTTAGQEILINGKPVRLFGFNRHESSPESGHTESQQLLVTDIQLLEQMGANFVRGSHYPQNTRFVDLCDQRGIMMWCEATGWQHTEEHLTDRRFLDAQNQNIKEMIRALGNHPSIIMWGLLNESHGHARGSRPGFAELVGTIRSEDSSRPVTYATCHVFEDKCLDLFDIVSFNTYPGWYVGSAKDIPSELDAILAHLDGSGYSEKPVILSEIGAGGIYGFRDWHRELWSEEYQAEVVQTVLDYFSNVERLAGLALWQFCDIRASESTARALRRPRGFNNKGIVDEYRRAKLAFHIVRQFGKGGR